MHIVNVACCFAEKYEMVADAAKRLQIPSEQARVFEKFFGLKKLPIDLEATVDAFMLSAANRCLAQANINRSQVRYVIHAHTANVISPFGHSVVRQLQRRLELNNAISFSTSMSKCSSVFVMFKMMRQLFLQLDKDDYILILTGDVTFTEILQFIPGTTITSDGASAILLSKHHDRNEIIHIEIDTYGQFAQGIWGDQEQQAVFANNYSQYLVNVINNCIRNANLSLEDIKIILPHNVNTLSWHKVIKILGITQDKVFLRSIADTGHCFGTDPFFNYQVARASNLILPGDYFILATVGLGATFAAMVFKA